MMTTNLTKRINESICAVGIPVLRRHRARVTKRPWKRALSSASLCASLTIEAALSLTLFMFMVILLSVPMEILDTQRKVQTVLEVTGRELGWQVYRTSHTVHPAEMEAGKAAEAGEKGTGGWSELPSGLILQGYLKEKIQTAGGNKVSNIQCGASRVSEDGEWIDLRASYQVRLPFSVFALDHVTLTSRSRKRGWIGAEGAATGCRCGGAAAGEARRAVPRGPCGTGPGAACPGRDHWGGPRPSVPAQPAGQNHQADAEGDGHKIVLAPPGHQQGGQGDHQEEI